MEIPKIKFNERGLGREAAWGLAHFDKNLIEIDKSLSGKRRLRVIIHEITHLSFPEMSERQTLRFERILGDFLWAQGYRKVELK